MTAKITPDFENEVIDEKAMNAQAEKENEYSGEEEQEVEE
jgi:hypothetical protein